MTPRSKEKESIRPPSDIVEDIISGLKEDTGPLRWDTSQEDQLVSLLNRTENAVRFFIRHQDPTKINELLDKDQETGDFLTQRRFFLEGRSIISQIRTELDKRI